MSVSTNSKFSTKNNANIATKSFPTADEGTRFLSLPHITTSAPIAKPVNACSVIGVSITRSSPNSSNKP